MPVLQSLASASARGFGRGISSGSVAVESFESIISYTASADIGTTITISPIPSTYKDLMIIQSAGATYSGGGGGSGGKLYFNSDTSVNCQFAYFYGNGNGTIQGGNGNQNWFDFSALWAGNGNQYAQQMWYISNYSSNTAHKTVQWQSGASLLAGTNGTNTSTFWGSGVWNSTNQITSLNLLHGSGYGDGNLRAGSRFSIFGIKG